MAAVKFTSLKDEEIVRVLKGSVSLSAPATYTETELATQLSIERGVIWLIHALEFHIIEPMLKVAEVGANASESIYAHVAREPKEAILDPDEPDLIHRYDIDIGRSAAIGTDAGPLWNVIEQPKVYQFTPPLPYAADSIYLGLNSTSGSVLTCHFRIRYTIRSVTDKYFFRIAQAILG